MHADFQQIGVVIVNVLSFQQKYMPHHEHTYRISIQ